MKLLDKWFFVAYNAYYKDGNYKNDIPAFTVAIQFTFVFGSLFSLFYDFYKGYLVYIINDRKLIREQFSFFTKTDIFIQTTLFLALSYFLFLHKHRYDVIYERYKDIPSLRTKKAKFFAFFAMLFSFASPFIFLILRNMFVPKA